MDYFINHQENEQKILIIGIGNEFRNDDGIGLYIVRRLRKLNFQNVTILEKSGEGTELMEAWQNNSRVFLFDAVRSGAKPGTIFRLTAHEEKIPQKFFNYSTHDFSLAEAVELAGLAVGAVAPFVVFWKPCLPFAQLPGPLPMMTATCFLLFVMALRCVSNA